MRRFGPIGTSVWSSRKFLALANDSNRLAYLYLIACPHGNALGLFRLPTGYFAADRRISHDDGEAMLKDMERVGLIRRDGETIRITSWFAQDTGANNPSTVSAFCKLFNDTREIKRGPLRGEAIAEMSHASLSRAESWNPNTDQFSRMVKDLQNLLIGQLRSPDSDALQSAMLQLPEPGANTVLNTVLDTVSHTVSTRWGTGWGTHNKQKQETETDTERDTETESETDTEKSSARAREGKNNPPPALPADSGQAADRGKSDEATDAAIAELNAKRRRAGK